MIIYIAMMNDTIVNHDDDDVTQAGASLSVIQDQLVRVHRALLLLKSHLETFRRKYAYHFR